ncbi:hypothetical protein [Nonomuraea basaltis]|uniref:hypothetical protein n=1 Tax=Nonomuraea basaltis TaxID=2495887 RepID=UPI00110C5DA3|nr:hypothetical protein [Nonomuraea basaltis]TMR90902.1 hypothetical protein EJK15_52800 [Nonomuraea basaltis]
MADDDQDCVASRNSLKRVAAVRELQDRHREFMGNIDAQINDLAAQPTSPISIEALTTVAAQLSLQRAVELMSLLHGDDLEKLAAGLVDEQWKRMRDQLPAQVAGALEDDDLLKTRILQGAMLAMAAMVTAGLANARIEPHHWPLPDLAELTLGLGIGAGLVNQMTEQISDFLMFGSEDPATWS